MNKILLKNIVYSKKLDKEYAITIANLIDRSDFKVEDLLEFFLDIKNEGEDEETKNLIEKLEEEISDLEEEIKTLEDERNDLGDKIDELEESNDELEKELTSLKLDIDKINAENDILQNYVDDKNS